MKKKRINNDLRIRWRLFFKDTQEPFSLAGKSVRVYLKNCRENREIDDFTIVDNVIHWVFRGSTQKYLGIYSLVLMISEGDEGMITIDSCNFVELVSSSCQEGGADSGNVHTESIDLVSTIDYVSVIGGTTVIIDTELSETSGNPIANSTVTAELKKKADAIELTELSLEVSGLSERIENLPSGESEVFEAKFKETSYDEIKEAFEANKVVYCYWETRIYMLIKLEGGAAYFAVTHGNYYYRLVCYPGTPSTSWGTTSENFQHTLKSLDNGNAQITIAGKTAEVATPQYVENLLGVIINGEY